MFCFGTLFRPPLKVCFSYCFIVPRFSKRASFVFIRLNRRARVYFVSVHSLSVFLLAWSELLFVKFHSSNLPAIAIEESALGVLQPVDLLCLEILTCLALSVCLKINTLVLELTLHLCPRP